MYISEHRKVISDEIMKSNLTHIDRNASVLAATRLMRKSGATRLLVTAEVGGELSAFGVLTAKDIVTRVIAAELDPKVLTTGDIAWPECNSNGARASINGARDTITMKEKAIERWENEGGDVLANPANQH